MHHSYPFFRKHHEGLCKVQQYEHNKKYSMTSWRVRINQRVWEIHQGLTVGVVTLFAIIGFTAAAVLAETTTEITNLRIENLYANGVDIRWDTSVLTDSTVYYGFAPGNYPYTSSPSQRCDGGALVTSHCVRLSGLTPGTTYYYRVRSTNDVVNYQADGSPFLAANTTDTTDTSGTPGILDTLPPSAPTAVSATALSSSEIIISWQAATDDVGVSAYKVFRDGTFIASVNVTNHKDTGLLPATTYSYRVAAVDATGKESELSVPTSAQTAPSSGGGTVPVSPTGFSAMYTNASYGPIVSFSWVDVAHEDAYKIYQRTAGATSNAWTVVSTVSANATGASIPAPSSGFYDYHVKACNGIGCSVESNIVNLAVDVCTSSSCDTSPPSPPSSLHTTTLSTSRIDIAWSPSVDNVRVSGYKVYRNGAYVTTVQTTAYSDPHVAPGISYSYSIVAFDDAGHSSEPSPVIFVTAPYNDASLVVQVDTNTEVLSPESLSTATTTTLTTTTSTATTTTMTVSPAPAATAPLARATTVPSTTGVFVTTGDSRCDLDTPLTMVTFGAIPEGGAVFRVTNQETGMVREIGAGRHFLPDGSYSWKALPYPGYVMRGVESGAFTLLAECAVAPLASSRPTPPAIVVEAPHSVSPPPSRQPSDPPLPHVRLNEPLTVTENATSSVSDQASAILSVSRPIVEYAAYCDDPAHNAECERFVTVKIDSFVPVSVAKGISPDALLPVIPAMTELPVPVETPAQFSALCAQATYASRCADILVEANVLSEEEARRRAEEVVKEHIKVDEILNERVGARALLDTDGDGISDYDEVNIYHTDPKQSDTNSDGVLDGDHLLIGTDPLYEFPVDSATTSTVGGILPILTGTSTAIPVALSRERPITREHPRFAGEKKPELLAIARVEAVPLEKEGIPATTTVRLAGKALPGSFVTIYVFSEPIIVVVKADETGAWEYTLDRELPDGTHEAWSAIVDANGRILAKSDPLPFVKVAEAVTIGSPALVAETAEPGFFSGISLYLFLGLLAFVVISAFFLIGWIARRSTQPTLPKGYE